MFIDRHDVIEHTHAVELSFGCVQASCCFICFIAGYFIIHADMECGENGKAKLRICLKLIYINIGYKKRFLASPFISSVWNEPRKMNENKVSLFYEYDAYTKNGNTNILTHIEDIWIHLFFSWLNAIERQSTTNSSCILCMWTNCHALSCFETKIQYRSGLCYNHYLRCVRSR